MFSFWNCRLLEKLPQINVTLLRYLFGVLHCIEQRSDTNKMTAFNLAVCIAPSLLWLPNPSSPEAEGEFTRKVTTVLKITFTMTCLSLWGILVIRLIYFKGRIVIYNLVAIHWYSRWLNVDWGVFPVWLLYDWHQPPFIREFSHRPLWPVWFPFCKFSMATLDFIEESGSPVQNNSSFGPGKE